MIESNSIDEAAQKSFRASRSKSGKFSTIDSSIAFTSDSLICGIVFQFVVILRAVFLYPNCGFEVMYGCL
ncbi:MAG TPA: hypothetical protein VGP12_08770, partial [Nitrosospira sp.]|nr:hypothetical protein [Nitrosospira sp.]